MIHVNEGLEYRAKLANGQSTDPFTYFVLGSETTAEDITNTYATMTVISTNGGEKKAATCTYVADYQAQWVVDFTFTGPLTINSYAIVNTANKMLCRHKFATTKTVSTGETMRITVTKTESR
jgi:hypothetical protein